MRKLLILFGLSIVFVNGVYAAPVGTTCSITLSCPSGQLCMEGNLISCMAYTTKYYNNVAVHSCSNCPSGLTRVERSVSVPGCDKVSYYDCVSSCTECPDCESEDWKPYSSSGTTVFITGYERKVTATCIYSTCTCSKRTQYRCAGGYYGSSLNGTSGCSLCPGNSYGEVLIRGGSVAGSNTDMTDCYVTSGGDESGLYSYTQNCYYTK